MLFLGKKFLSPPGISPEGGGTCLLLDHWASCLSPGVQGEGEPRADGQGEVEGLALLCPCLAKVHALGGQGGVNITHCIHFDFTSELRNSSNFREHVAALPSLSLAGVQEGGGGGA